MSHEEQNNQLIDRLLAGDVSARDELIIRNRPLIKATVQRVLLRWPGHNHLHDDLISEGYLALTQVVHDMVERPVSFRNLIISAARHAIQKMFQRHEEPYYNTHQHPKMGVEGLSDKLLATEDKAPQQVDDRDFLLAQCVNSREKAILRLYLDCHTLREIATQFGTTRWVIRRVIRRFRARVRSDYPDWT